jgi:myosin heavy subunit
LDEIQLVSKASDATLVDKLISLHSNHPNFKKQAAKDKFGISHFAGDIVYNAR